MRNDRQSIIGVGKLAKMLFIDYLAEEESLWKEIEAQMRQAVRLQCITTAHMIFRYVRIQRGGSG